MNYFPKWMKNKWMKNQSIWTIHACKEGASNWFRQFQLKKKATCWISNCFVTSSAKGLQLRRLSSTLFPAPVVSFFISSRRETNMSEKIQDALGTRLGCNVSASVVLLLTFNMLYPEKREDPFRSNLMDWETLLLNCLTKCAKMLLLDASLRRII